MHYCLFLKNKKNHYINARGCASENMGTWPSLICIQQYTPQQTHKLNLQCTDVQEQHLVFQLLDGDGSSIVSALFFPLELYFTIFPFGFHDK